MPLTESQTRYVNFYTDFAFKKLFGTEAKQVDEPYLEMPKYKKSLPQLNTLYEKWLYAIKHLGELDERPAELKEAIFNRLFEIAEIAKYTPQERQDYEESLKNFRDWYSCLHTAERKGRAEGRQEGRDERSVEIARNMKEKKYPIEDIILLTGLTEEEICAL